MRETGLRLVLKEATHDLHRQLETRPLLASLLQQDINLQVYVAAMTRLATAYAPIDTAIEAAETAAELPGDCTYVKRSQWLGPFAPQTGLPLSELDIEKSEYFGARYVIEGSTMGASMILDRLLASGLTADLRFWQEQAAHSRHWHRYCALLDRLEDSEGMRQSAVQGARKVFRLLLDTFPARTCPCDAC